MKNQSALYHSIWGLFKPKQWKDARLHHLFSMMVESLIQSKSIHLPDWIPYISGNAQYAQSTQRRLRRFLANESIEIESIYDPLIQEVLSEWKESEIYIALDTSMLFEKFCSIRLSIIYRGRAIPLAWKVIEHKSSMIALGQYQQLLSRSQKLLPKDVKVVFLADRGFADIELMKLCSQLGWNYRIRIKGSFWITLANGIKKKIQSIKLPKGRAMLLKNTAITKDEYGPVHLAIGRHSSSNEYWQVVSNEPIGLKVFEEYGMRFDIEEEFLDEKSNGFQLEDSGIRVADDLEKLILVIAIASIYLVAQGQEVVRQGLRRTIDPHWFRGDSYLKIGWKWILTALVKSMKIVRQIRLDSWKDPDPAIASKAQHRKRKRRFKLHYYPVCIT